MTQTVERPLEGKVAVITGNRRGIGAAISVTLAEAGANIAGNYVDAGDSKLAQNKQTRSDQLGRTLDSLGVLHSFTPADITVAADRRRLVIAALDLDTIHPKGEKGIDFLILNAAGGLEQGKPDNWPDIINNQAQVGLVREALSFIREGGVVMYITSLWAHRFGEVKMLAGYGEVARSKNEGEKNLRAMMPQLDERNIRLLITCGVLVEGTSAFALFKKFNQEQMEALRKILGEFPNTEDMAASVRGLILSNWPSGTTFYVGGTEVEPLIQQEGRVLNRQEVSSKLPMYGDQKLLVDTFNTATGEATYRVRWGNTVPVLTYDDANVLLGNGAVKTYDVTEGVCDGHFAGPFADVQLFRAVDQLKIAGYRRGMELMKNNPDLAQLPQIISIKGASFENMAFPGDTLTLTDGVDAGTEMFWQDRKISSVREIGLADYELSAGDRIFDLPEALEALAQSIGLLYLEKEQGDGIAVYRGIDEAEQLRPIRFGEQLTIRPVIDSVGRSLVGHGEILVGEEVVVRAKGIRLDLAPNEKMARRIVRMQQKLREKPPTDTV